MSLSTKLSLFSSFLLTVGILLFLPSLSKFGKTGTYIIYGVAFASFAGFVIFITKDLDD